MENLLNLGIQIIQWFQHLGPWLTPIMKLFALIGSVQFYILAISTIFWCVDAALGLRLGLFLMISATLNEALKVGFHGPRPYWYSREVTALGSPENTFGAPSGHGQNAVVFWGTIAKRMKTRLVWIIIGILIILIGLSRIYLALHFPHDVLLGWLVGAILIWVLLHYEKPVVSWLTRYSLIIQLLLIFLFTMILFVIVIIFHLVLGSWSVPPVWVSNAHQAFPTEPPINPLSYKNSVLSIGAFFGMAAGWIWMSRAGGFTVQDAWYRLLLRYILGLAGVAILYLGIDQIIPTAESIVSYILVYIQFVLIGLWITGFAPWLFVKFKLASHTK